METSKQLEYQASLMISLSKLIRSNIKANGLNTIEQELIYIKIKKTNITKFKKLTFDRVVFCYEDEIEKRIIKIENENAKKNKV